jgi:hypothetical protein
MNPFTNATEVLLQSESDNLPEKTADTGMGAITTSNNDTSGIVQPIQPVKKSRGRPKKETANIPVQPQPAQPQPAQPQPAKSINDILAQELSEYKQTGSIPVPDSTGTNAQSLNLSNFIRGSLLLIMIDSIMPNLLIKLLGMVSPSYRSINPNKVKMTKEQRDQLEPLANEMVNVIFGNMPAHQMFFVCLSFVYAGNIMEEVNKVDEKLNK